MQMFLFFYFLILSLVYPSIINATCNENLCDDATAPGITDRSDWMANLIDQLQLKQFSLPGTHDSGTYGNLVGEIGGTWYTDCQVWSVDIQLKTGIRFFDWRLESRANSIYIHHGDYSFDVSWTSILDTCYDFLTKHKSETLIFRLGFSGISSAFFSQIIAPYADKIVF
jgi:1-phosphatidylinositol phosphodiesterase